MDLDACVDLLQTTQGHEPRIVYTYSYVPGIIFHQIMYRYMIPGTLRRQTVQQNMYYCLIWILIVVTHTAVVHTRTLKTNKKERRTSYIRSIESIITTPSSPRDKNNTLTCGKMTSKPTININKTPSNPLELLVVHSYLIHLVYIRYTPDTR